MDYSKYYTPPKTASLLINELSIQNPQKVIDICCGSCNLLFAAKKKWNNVSLYGVDVSDCRSLTDVFYEKKDGRQYAVEHSHEFPLVLANPPFDFVESKNQFPELFVNEFKNITTSRLEVEMLIANLTLLSPNGVLLIILPSSFVEAETYKAIRQVIANNYYVESIIKLDETTFGASRINSYALIVHNKLNTQYSVKTGNVIGDLISYTKNISCKMLKDGFWTHQSTAINKNYFDIKRGNISSGSFVAKGQPILHTAKDSDDWKPGKRYISRKTIPKVFAESGDIIVSRIGKSAGKWCVYEGERIPISDCLFRIKDPDCIILKSIKGKYYNGMVKGVATSYITIPDFCSWINALAKK